MSEWNSAAMLNCLIYGDIICMLEFTVITISHFYWTGIQTWYLQCISDNHSNLNTYSAWGYTILQYDKLSTKAMLHHVNSISLESIMACIFSQVYTVSANKQQYKRDITVSKMQCTKNPQ